MKVPVDWSALLFNSKRCHILREFSVNVTPYLIIIAIGYRKQDGELCVKS